MLDAFREGKGDGKGKGDGGVPDTFFAHLMTTRGASFNVAVMNRLSTLVQVRNIKPLSRPGSVLVPSSQCKSYAESPGTMVPSYLMILGCSELTVLP